MDGELVSTILPRKIFMLFFLLAGFLSLLGLMGLVYALLLENDEDPRFEGDKLIYRS